MAQMKDFEQPICISTKPQLFEVVKSKTERTLFKSGPKPNKIDAQKYINITPNCDHSIIIVTCEFTQKVKVFILYHIM